MDLNEKKLLNFVVNLGTLMIKNGAEIPVSYTHLDVYKRQATGAKARAVVFPIFIFEKSICPTTSPL